MDHPGNTTTTNINDNNSSNLDLLQKWMHTCRVAGPHDVVLNTECCFCFHSPFTSDNGVCVSCQCFIGTGVVDLVKVPGIYVRVVKKRVPKSSSTTASTSTSSSSAASNDNDGDAVMPQQQQQPPSSSSEEASPPEAALLPAAEAALLPAADNSYPTTLGIGVAGGFMGEQDKYEIISHYSVVVFEKDAQGRAVLQAEWPYNDETKASLFPLRVVESVESIIHHVGMTTQQDLEVWQLQESIPVSKYAADLPFVDNGVMISPDPSVWKCQTSGDAENLWLNLSDGYIGGGRRHWDGSGGSNGALDHYEETGRQYPLVVKLGTITSDLNTADCYSYAPDEDGPVKVPNLAELLDKRGIKVASMQKTAKSTAELEIQLNATYAFDAITEAGAPLQLLSGPSLQGLQNLGNSCYMNSVVQLLLSGTIPELAHRYGIPPHHPFGEHPLLQAASQEVAPYDVLVQTTKLASALTSGAFARPIAKHEDYTNQNTDDTHPKYRLAPRLFRHCIGKDHVEFRTGQQQDAAQYLQYLLERLDRAERGATHPLAKRHLYGGINTAAATSSSTDSTDAQMDGGSSRSAVVAGSGDQPMYVTSHLFAFNNQTRLVCRADGRVKYQINGPETIWTVPIPMEKAVTIEPEQRKTSSLVQEVAATSKTEPSSSEADANGGNAHQDPKRLKTDTEKEKEAKDNKDKPEQSISFATCVEAWASETIVHDIRWPHLQNAKHDATAQVGFATFPRYLIVHMQRYQLGPDWRPIKLEVLLDIPEHLDLNPYRMSGPRPDDNLVPQEEAERQGVAAAVEAASKPAGPVIDEMALAQLMDMGFTLNSCKRALHAVGGSNVEAAMTWVFEHNMDPDFDDPLPDEHEESAAALGGGGGGSGAKNTIDDAAIESLAASLGCFSPEQLRSALTICHGDTERAADWLFSHIDNLEECIRTAMEEYQPSSSSSSGGSSSSSSSTFNKVPLDDGDGQYTMMGMISHIGKHTGSGHYVAHLKRDGDKWVIFNDEKVALSVEPPFQHAYMYLFQRNDSIGTVHPRY